MADLGAMAQAEIRRLMRIKNVDQAELAQRLGVPRTRVRYMLTPEGRYMTLRTVERCFRVLDAEPKLSAVPR